ncbi:MAG: SwmB domain-containing protein, partial [Pseudomonadota bacterium]
YASGSGTSTLTFTYTVQAGDTAADLDYISTGALALNGGAIQDAAGNNATLALASPGAANSLGANKNFVIDTTAPTVSGVTSSTTNGGYKAGDVISVQVNFSEAVTVTGTPQLTLETGATDRVVNYASGSGTSTLTFTYTVQAGDTSADLDYISTGALALNGGTVRDVAGNDATLTLASPGAANSLGANKAIVIDTTPPTVSGVTSTAANGTYKIGDVIAVQVNFSEAINVTGTPQLTLETGATDRTLNYASGSGSSTLVFNYTVQAGDTTADLDYLGTSALVLNGGTVRDGVGNNATLTLAAPGAANSLGANKNIVIDGITPTVTGVTSSAANGTYKLGDVVSIQVNFSESVNVTGTPQLTLETGSTDRVLNYASGSGTGTLTFTYTVQAGDTSADLDYTGTSALALNGGTIKDLAGNTAVLTLASPGAANSLGANKAIVIDGIVPTVSGVTSTNLDGLYQVGDVITIQVNFSETVNVTGTPQLTLETGTTDEVLNYAGGSGSSTLTFTYTVQEGDNTADLDYLGTTALALNGGTIRDGAGNDATLTLAAPGAANSLGANKNIVIDGIPPTVAGVSSSTANGLYKVGDVILVQVEFSETVNVFGTPQLTLETGSTDRVVNYTSGSGTSTLTFAYTVQTGDTSADLDYLSNGALALNGGTITDAAGNDATLTLPEPGAAGSLGANKNLALDTTAPVFSSAAVNATTLVLSYIEADALNAGAAPATGAFTVKAGNKVIDVNSVVVNALAKTVTLTLGEAVTSSQLVVISYTDPTAGDDANAIQDAAGNDAASLVAVAVTNNTPVPPPPTNTPGTSGPIANSSHPGMLPERGDILAFDPLSIVDPDGGAKIGSITYQWLRDGAAINGATGATYQVGLNDSGKLLSLTVNYLDGADHHEALFLTASGRSGDGDGVPAAIELLVPALLPGGLVGDGNGDGLLDAYQVDVLSALLPNQPGQTGTHYITLVGDSAQGGISGDPNHAVINGFSTGTVTGQAPAVLRMNTTLNFSVNVGFDGLLETFSIFVEGSVGARGFWLLGNNGHWHNVTAGIAQVGNMTRLDFFVADGGPFDRDGTANGVINFTGVVADPPASIIGAAPTIILPGVGGNWLLF